MLIEADKPLSQSLLWQIQNSYFHTAGIRAWQNDVVPHQISCNPFMARAYANLITAYIQDLGDSLNHDEPIYIIELGAGSGRLTFYLMHQLEEMWADLSPFRFVLTDYTADLLHFWQIHPQLQPYITSGQLDFALFDATQPAPLKLHNSQQEVTPQTADNPIILLGNYFFDSIPQDSFVIKQNELHSNLLSLYSTQAEPDLNDVTLWERLTLAYEPLPLDTPYDNPLYNEILFDYEQLPDTSITFPNIGLDCLQFWLEASNLLLLTADRGHTHAIDLLDQPDPLPNLHGSFSMMVNYHAMTEFIERSGGRAFYPPHYQDQIQTLAYIWPDKSNTQATFEHTFRQTICQNGPSDYFSLRTQLLSQIPEMQLPQFLSLMRWSAGDPDLLRVALDHLPYWLAQYPAWTQDTIEMLQQVHDQYLQLGENDRLPLLIEQRLGDM